MFWVRTNNAQMSLTFYHLAIITYFFDCGSNSHIKIKTNLIKTRQKQGENPYFSMFFTFHKP